MERAAQSDGELVASVARGDKRSLGALYERYGPLMLGLAVKMLKDQQAAEDLLHDVFVEVWRRAGDYNPDRASVRTWLSIRVRSRCLDRLRSARSRKSDSLDERRDAGSQDGLAHEWPDGLAELSLDAIRMRTLIRTLPEHQRRVLELGYFDGMTSSEISRQLEIPVGTVKSRMRTALSSLRKALGVDSHA